MQRMPGSVAIGDESAEGDVVGRLERAHQGP